MSRRLRTRLSAIGWLRSGDAASEEDGGWRFEPNIFFFLCFELLFEKLIALGFVHLIWMK